MTFQAKSTRKTLMGIAALLAFIGLSLLLPVDEANASPLAGASEQSPHQSANCAGTHDFQATAIFAIDWSGGTHDHDHHEGSFGHTSFSCCAVGCVSALLPASPTYGGLDFQRHWSVFPGNFFHSRFPQGLYRPPRIAA